MKKHALKPTNPKDSIADTRLPLGAVPSIVSIMASLGFAEGALKYGRFNWRIAGVRSSVYKHAMQRHMEKWWEGEDFDPLTKVPHLASVICCAGIIEDARQLGKLNDDRPPKAPAARSIRQAERVLAHLQKLFRDRKPKQYTIKDKTCLRKKQ